MKNKNKENHNKEKHNKEIRNIKTPNKETQNKETHNKETHNKETPNKEIQSNEIGNAESKTTGRKKIPDKILLAAGSLILLIFVMTGIFSGADLSDTTYSLANYKYFNSLEGSWKYATFLANLTGFLLVKVFGGNMIMMNMATSMFIVITAGAVMFSLRKIIPIPVLFAGEVIAIGLCWCPSVILYNYLSYLLLTVACLLLFFGMLGDRKGFLFLAGICLGLNFFVRISNAAQVILILWVVFAYYAKKTAIRREIGGTGLLTAIGMCVLGYLAGVLSGFVILFIYEMSMGGNAAARLGEVFSWITGLLGIGKDEGNSLSSGTGYSFADMLGSVLENYKGNLTWAGMLVGEVLLGSVFFDLEFIERSVKGKNKAGTVKAIGIIKRICYTVCVVLLFVYYERNGIFNLTYTNTGSVFRISVVFILVTVLVVLADMTAGFRCSPEERMLACMCFILIAITPIGTNNHLFAVINNMFIIAPVSLYLMIQLLGDIRDKKFHYPVAVMFFALIAVMIIQSAIFGVVYTFKDGEDGTKRSAVISEKIPTMSGVRTTAAHAEALEGLSEYIASTDAADKGLIVWGNMPGLFYILDQKPELNTLWPDLDSYPYDDFSAGLTALQESKKDPLLIISAEEAEAFGGAKGYSYSAGEEDDLQIMLKRMALMEFMLLGGYRCSYSNQEFFVYEPYHIEDIWQNMQWNEEE
ncbi:MAG: hypothetical protein K6C99_03750 [Lachnospiraceae bacterium]|nr:hypothetical protein [Lachnospiraceae bacterium]